MNTEKSGHLVICRCLICVYWVVICGLSCVYLCSPVALSVFTRGL